MLSPGANSSHIQQQKFLSLRRKLADLNYTESFGIEACDLVEKLMNDLLLTTDSYRLIQEKESRLAGDLTLAQSQLFPLRKENTRLSRENHQLHLENIHQNDKKQLAIDEQMVKVRKYQDELAELKLLLKAKDEQLSSKDKSIEKLRDLYESVTDPSLKTTKSIGNSITMKVPFKIRSSSVHNDTTHYALPTSVQRASLDDGILVESLREQLESLKLKLTSSEHEIIRLQQCIESREQELVRANDLLASSELVDSSSSGSSPSAARVQQLMAVDVGNKRIIDQLNSQVDFLNEQVAMRETQLLQLTEKINQYDQISVELNQKNELLEQSRKYNSELSGHTRALEEKVIELQERLEDRSDVGSEVDISAIRNDSEKDKQRERLIAQLQSEKSSLLDELAETRKRQQIKKIGGGGGKVMTGGSLVVDLNKEVMDLSAKVNQLSKALKLSEDKVTHLQMSRITSSSSSSSSSELLKMKEDIENFKVAAEKDQILLMDSLRDRNQLKTLLDSTLEQNSNLRVELRDCKNRLDELEMKNKVISKESESRKEMIEKYQMDVSIRDEELAILRIQYTTLSDDLRLEQSRSTMLQQTLTDKSLALETQSSQLHDTLMKLQYEKTTSTSTSNHFLEQQREEINRLKEQVQTLEIDKESWNRDKELLMDLSNSLGISRTSITNVTNESLHHNQKELVGAIRQKDEVIQDLQLQVQEFQQIQKMSKSSQLDNVKVITSLRADLEEMKRSHDDQNQQIDRLKSEIVLRDKRLIEIKQNNEISLQNFEEIQSSLEVTTKQLKSCRIEVQQLQQQLNESTHHTSSINDESRVNQNKLLELTSQLKSYRFDLQKCSSDKSDLEKEIHELKALVSSMDITYRDVNRNNSSLKEVIDRHENVIRNLEKENKQWNDSSIEMKKQMNRLQEVIHNIDRERDDLQEQLDRMEQEEIKWNNIQKNNENNILQWKQANEQAEKRINNLNKELNISNRQCVTLESKLNSFVIENNELKRRINLKSVEIGGTTEDLVLMTRENQMLTTELATISAEKEKLKTKISEMTQSMTFMEQSRRAIEIEKGDLLETYRSVLKQKRELESNLSHVSSVRDKENMTSQQLESQLAELRGTVDFHNDINNKWISEKISMSKQLETLNDQVLKAKHKIDALEADNRRMMHDTHALKQTNAMLNDRINVTIQRATSATEANTVLTCRLSEVERERDAVRFMVGIERQRATEMQQVAEAARVQAAQKEMQINRMQINRTTRSTDDDEDERNVAEDTDDSVVFTSESTSKEFNRESNNF